MAKATKAPVDSLAINPGELRHQVQIQQQSSTQTVSGALENAWTTVLTTMAKISTQTSREAWQAQQFTALVSHVILIRYPVSGISIQGGMRVVFGTKVYKIQTVENPLEQNRILKLHCVEINGVQ